MPFIRMLRQCVRLWRPLLTGAMPRLLLSAHPAGPRMEEGMDGGIRVCSCRRRPVPRSPPETGLDRCPRALGRGAPPTTCPAPRTRARPCAGIGMMGPEPGEGPPSGALPLPPLPAANRRRPNTSFGGPATAPRGVRRRPSAGQGWVSHLCISPMRNPLHKVRQTIPYF